MPYNKKHDITPQNTPHHTMLCLPMQHFVISTATVLVSGSCMASFKGVLTANGRTVITNCINYASYDVTLPECFRSCCESSGCNAVNFETTISLCNMKICPTTYTLEIILARWYSLFLAIWFRSSNLSWLLKLIFCMFTCVCLNCNVLLSKSSIIESRIHYLCRYFVDTKQPSYFLDGYPYKRKECFIGKLIRTSIIIRWWSFDYFFSSLEKIFDRTWWVHFMIFWWFIYVISSHPKQNYDKKRDHIDCVWYWVFAIWEL